MDYYALLTPGLASDWGQIILVDARIVDFLQYVKNFDLDDEQEIKELKSEYKKKEWEFLKSEFKLKDETDFEFLKSIENDLNSDLSENYYQLKELESTYHFYGITEVVDFALEYDVKVIGNIT